GVQPAAAVRPGLLEHDQPDGPSGLPVAAGGRAVHPPAADAAGHLPAADGAGDRLPLRPVTGVGPGLCVVGERTVQPAGAADADPDAGTAVPLRLVDRGVDGLRPCLPARHTTPGGAGVTGAAVPDADHVPALAAGAERAALAVALQPAGG